MRAPRRNAIALLGASLAAGATAIPAHADGTSPVQQLYTVEQTEAQSRAQRETLEKAALTLSVEIDGLRAQSVSTVDAMRHHEAALSMLEGQLQSLGAEAAAKAAELKRDEARRGGLLMALVALAHNPPVALALASPDPVTAERSALVLGDAVPPLDRAARRLSNDLKQLAALRLAIAQAQEKHRAEQTQLSSQRLHLSDLIARKSELEHQAQVGSEQNAEKIAALAAEAANLKDLIQRVEAERMREALAPNPPPPKPKPGDAGKSAPDTGPKAIPVPVAVATAAIGHGDASKPAKLRSFLDAVGHYEPPTSGKVVQGFGKADNVGLTSQGLDYETRAGAEVVAPYDGRVLYAGPFRGYGEILIIEHDDGYHSLLAGLDRLDVSVGQWLVTGEPVGTMPKGEDKPRLYLELRHDGRPINPLPWLATSNEKVSG